jgi:hypothetical protein
MEHKSNAPIYWLDFDDFQRTYQKVHLLVVLVRLLRFACSLCKNKKKRWNIHRFILEIL